MAKYLITEKTPQPYRGAMRAPGDEIEIDGNARYEVSLGILTPASVAPKKPGKGRRGSPVTATAALPDAEAAPAVDGADGPADASEV